MHLFFVNRQKETVRYSDFIIWDFLAKNITPIKDVFAIMDVKMSTFYIKIIIISIIDSLGGE